MEDKQVSGKYFLDIIESIFLQLSLFFRPYWRCYYSNTDAIIYVVDSADKDRIGISKEELFQMLRVSKKFILNYELYVNLKYILGR